jgi:hypothetical protein
MGLGVFFPSPLCFFEGMGYGVSYPEFYLRFLLDPDFIYEIFDTSIKRDKLFMISLACRMGTCGFPLGVLLSHWLSPCLSTVLQKRTYFTVT